MRYPSKYMASAALLIAIVFSVYVSVAYAEGGYTWTQQTTSGSRQWVSTASSDDGLKLAAADRNGGNGGFIYTSTDGGATWAARAGSGSRAWVWITSSSDGTKLAAVDDGNNLGGYIYTSTDSGATWTQRTGSDSRRWQAITSSADGTKLAAAVYGGYVYTSTDSGATWTERTGVTNNFESWESISSSADSTKLVVVGDAGRYLYTSTDSGATWTQRTGAGSRNWLGVTSSSDGAMLAAVDFGGNIYTSTDSGATWTERVVQGALGWAHIASSDDGTILVAVDDEASGAGAYLYTSIDSGATWTQQTSAGSRIWGAPGLSTDGTKIAVGVGQVWFGGTGYIYTATYTNPDSTVPSYSVYTPSAGVTSFSLTLSADETSTSTISYGLLSGARVATSTSANTTSHSHSLTGLVSCATYQYVQTLTDTAGNASSSPYTFRTTGCPTSASVATSSQMRVATTTGGTATLEDLTLTIPIGYSTSTSSFDISRLDTAAVIASLGTPVGDDQTIGDHIFNLGALISATTSTSTFMQNITVTIDYDAGDIPSGVDPSSLAIYRNDGSSWQELSCTLNTVSTSISCTTNQFSVFGLFGTYTSSSASTASTVFSSGGSSPAAREAYLRALYAANNLPYPGDTPLTTSALTRALYQTLNHPEVLTLQKLLNAKGYVVSTTGPGSPGLETTYFGGKTTAAVQRLQCATLQICSGTPSTTGYGYVGPRTRGVIGAR